MASLQERTGTYRVIFRFHGKQHFVMIGKVSPEEAETKAAQVEYLLMRLMQGLIELPPGGGIVEFVQHDGKPPAAATPTGASRKALTPATLRDRFLATRATGREKSGNERVKGTRPERLIGTHLGLQDSRLGQERQPGFTPPCDSSWTSSTHGSDSSRRSSRGCGSGGSAGPKARRSSARPGRSGPTR